MFTPAKVIVPLTIIGIGGGWLLNSLGVFTPVDWIWTIALGLAGLLILVSGKMDKLRFVIGLFLLAASVLSWLRQSGRMRVELEVPILVILLGGLWLTAEIGKLPTPEWPKEEEPAKRPRS